MTGWLKTVVLSLFGSIGISSGIAAIGGGDFVGLGLLVGIIWTAISLDVANRCGWLKADVR